MARCEDYPCCGHEAGDCPDEEGRMTCVECGGRLPKNAASSMHPKCQKRFLAQLDAEENGERFYHDEY